MAGAIAFVAWLPGYRLDAEIAAARREGLWTEMSDVSKSIAAKASLGENAAPLVREAIAADKALGKEFGKEMGYVREVNRNQATPAHRAALRAVFVGHPRMLEHWRAASARPRLDYGRKWQDGYAILLLEYAPVKAGALRLVAAARLGIQPKENLLAAARLSALTRQEPTVIAPLVAISIGHAALREAKRQGRSREVEAALGPPIDVRYVFAGELPSTIDIMRPLGTPEGERKLGNPLSPSVAEQIRHTGPWKTNAIRAVVHGWRELWRDLPKDRSDYEGAAKALDRHMPGIESTLASYSELLGKLMDGPGEFGRAARAFATYEAERKAARASK